MLSAYIGNYLQDEIVAEARLRNVAVFSRFLDAAAFSNGEIVNYTNIASAIGVTMPTVKEYFKILEDTLIGRFVPSYQKNPKRRVISAPKFYLFDIGVANTLLNRSKIDFVTELFGRAFEHFIYQELFANSKYSEENYRISYWRTASQIEVDFILGDNEVAVEIKSSNNINSKHLNGLKAFSQEYAVKRLILVCNESAPRLVDGIQILPWKIFLQQLWNGEII
jgi:predicted AAA+ superfamily ATPase